MTKYIIYSMPRAIGFVCPHCQEKQEIKVEDLQEDVFEMTDVECPNCHKDVDLDGWEYD